MPSSCSDSGRLTFTFTTMDVSTRRHAAASIQNLAGFLLATVRKVLTLSHHNHLFFWLFLNCWPCWLRTYEALPLASLDATHYNRKTFTGSSDSSEPQQLVLDWWNCLNQLCRIENGSDFFTFQTRTTMKISDLNHQFLWIKSNQVWTQSNHGKKLVTGFKWFRLLRYFRSEPKKKSDLNSRNCGFQGQIGWFRSETPK